MTGIYKIENLVNGKVYIGQAIDLKKRLNGHKKCLKGQYHHNRHLQMAYNKYGKENFKFEVIEECVEDKLTEREQYWIDYYGGINSNDNYNLREANMKGSLSLETRQKMSNHCKGRVFSYETRQKMSKNHADVSGKNNPMYGKPGGMRGKHRTEEWKQIARERFSGKNNPMYGKHNDFNSGRIYINNGIISKMIYPVDLDLYIKLGYKRGMLPVSKETKLKQSIAAKNSLKRKNRFWINNGNIELLIQQSIFEEYKLKGFIKGRLPNEKLGRRITQCRKGYIIMKNKFEIILKYDFDPEEGYTEKSIELDNSEWTIYENALNYERKLIVHLYEEDIKELLKGTGIEIDG